MINSNSITGTFKVIYVILIMLLLSLSILHAEQPDEKNIDTEKIEIESEENNSITETRNNSMDNEEIPIETENLFETVKQGGPLMIFIVMLGLVSLTITIERIIHYTRKGVWKNDELEKILNDSADASSARYREDLEDELRSVFFVYQNDLEKGLPLLSGIGNLSPIVGFLGTVIGMISAFAAIAAATTVNAKVVAVGIQIALVTTAGGLLVAAPSLFFFYIFTHVIQNRYTMAENIISERSSELPRLSTTIEKEDIE
ncbi:MAG: MotA/TolQ/ExbB proton channel family protein [Spirochaetota bacterium]